MVLKVILFGSIVGAFVLVPGSDATNADVFDYLESFRNELELISSTMGFLSERAVTNSESCDCKIEYCTCVIKSVVNGKGGREFRINKVYGNGGYQTGYGNAPSQAQEEGVTVTHEKEPETGVGVLSVNISVGPGGNVSNSNNEYQPGLGVAVDGVPQGNVGYENGRYKPGLGNTVTIGGRNQEVSEPVHQSGSTDSPILGQRDEITVTQDNGPQVPGPDSTNAEIFDYLETFRNELKKIRSTMGFLAESTFTNSGSCNCHAAYCTCVIMSEVGGNVGGGFQINRVYGTSSDQTGYGSSVEGVTQGNVDSGTTAYQLGSGDQVPILGENKIVIKPGYQPQPTDSPSEKEEKRVPVTEEKKHPITRNVRE